MLQAVLVTVSLFAPAQNSLAPSPVQAHQQVLQGGANEGSPPVLATFIPICRDRRGNWDRRACRHVRRNDPARLTLA